ncbi:GIN domain-containing protein [Aurantibacter sp.]|uniref:GIN domain-containing protein n=1 Tax=Aurantibacter sp. TaxID=2807103 RepID=UPI0035C7EE51
MKNLILSLITIISIATISNAQEKIKGSREVATKLKTVTPFNRLVVGEEFEVRLLRSDEYSVEVTADDNLHDVIEIMSFDGTLSFKTTKKITSAKKMEITVFYSDSLNTIEVKDKAEIHSDVTLKFKDLTLLTNQNSKTYLTVKSNKFKLSHNEDSKAELNITADNITLELNDNSNIKALVNSNNLEIDMVQRSKAKIEGDTPNLELNVDNSCQFTGEKLTAKKAKLTTNNRCKVEIEVKEELTINASGTSEISIYGTPKINLNKFEDEAVLYKKK